GAETELENYDTAILLYRKIIARLQDDPSQINNYITALNNIGDIDMRIGDYEAARQVLEQAYNLASMNKEQYDPQIILFNLGYVDVFLGDIEKGLNEMREVVEPARQSWPPAELEGLLGEYAD